MSKLTPVNIFHILLISFFKKNSQKNSISLQIYLELIAQLKQLNQVLKKGLSIYYQKTLHLKEGLVQFTTEPLITLSEEKFITFAWFFLINWIQLWFRCRVTYKYKHFLAKKNNNIFQVIDQIKIDLKSTLVSRTSLFFKVHFKLQLQFLEDQGEI